MKEQNNPLGKKTKWGGAKQSTWKIIQANDIKNDTKSQKQNRGIDQNIEEIFNKELKDLKNKQLNNKIAEMKNTLGEIISRVKRQKKAQVSWEIDWWK